MRVEGPDAPARRNKQARQGIIKASINKIISFRSTIHLIHPASRIQLFDAQKRERMAQPEWIYTVYA